MTAVLATFVDVKTIKTRSMIQIVLELPIEEADKAMKALGGFPLPAESRWVGVALAPKNRPKDGDLIETDPQNQLIPLSEEQKKHRQFDSLQPSAQAAILANDPEFVKFLTHKQNTIVDMSTMQVDVPKTIRKLCKVESRSEFNTDMDAANRWRVLRSQFKQFQTDLRYEASRTR